MTEYLEFASSRAPVCSLSFMLCMYALMVAFNGGTPCNVGNILGSIVSTTQFANYELLSIGSEAALEVLKSTILQRVALHLSDL